MTTKLEQIKNATKLSIVQLKSIHGGLEEEDFCTDDRRDFLLGCDVF